MSKGYDIFNSFTEEYSAYFSSYTIDEAGVTLYWKTTRSFTLFIIQARTLGEVYPFLSSVERPVNVLHLQLLLSRIITESYKELESYPNESSILVASSYQLALIEGKLHEVYTLLENIYKESTVYKKQIKDKPYFISSTPLLYLSILTDSLFPLNKHPVFRLNTKDRFLFYGSTSTTIIKPRYEGYYLCYYEYVPSAVAKIEIDFYILTLEGEDESGKIDTLDAKTFNKEVDVESYYQDNSSVPYKFNSELLAQEKGDFVVALIGVLGVLDRERFTELKDNFRDYTKL